MIPTFDGQSDPMQFLMSFEATVISGGDDETTLAKSLVMAVKGPSQQWYSSLKAKSIHSWDQLKANLLVDFQGFQPAGLTDIDLFNCKQQIKEPLSQYFKRFIQIKAQIPNIPDEVVIIAAIKGLRVGQCASHLAREKPSTVTELYEVIQKYCKSDDDYRKRIEEENNFRAQIKQNNNFHPPKPNNYERRPFTPHNQVNQIENDNNSTAESDYAHQNQYNQ